MNRYGKDWGICSTEGCDKPVWVKKLGLCNSHSQLYYRKNKTGPACKLDWCSNVSYSIGYCQYHYDLHRQGLPIPQPKSVMKCVGPECDRDAVTSDGLCRTHYMQRYLGNELKPIRPWHYKVDGDKKQCITCGEFKDIATEFHARKGILGQQSECKVCMYRRTRANLEKRRLRQGVDS